MIVNTQGTSQVVIERLQARVKELENIEEKAHAIVKYMRKENIDAVLAVVAELGLLFPPQDNGDW